MKHLTFLALLGAADAFPQVAQLLSKRDYAVPGCTTSALCDKVIEISDAEAHIPAKETALTRISKARSNCGALSSCTTFDAADQYISNTGKYAFKAPSASDIRGPCPGLNAAANHGYIPRNGVLNSQQTVDGLQKLYGMSPDLGLFLAAYSIAFDGDLTTGLWSIGGPLPANPLSTLTGVPQGDGYSHNNYEGDTSITRCDSYTNGGDAHASSKTRFGYAYESYNDDKLYTMDTMSRLYAKNTHRSIQSNAYYFAPLFSTTLVSPAAYNFVIAFMSNHSEASPGGYLTPDQFMTWFGYKGTYPNVYWDKGMESIPDNWYRRPSSEEYSIAGVFGDLIPEFAAYPDTFRFGGNTGGTNTYTGVDIENFSGGVYDATDLLKGDNLACFFFQNEQQAVPEELVGGLNDVAEAADLVLNALGPFGKSLNCPEIGKYDTDGLTKYTGYGYKPLAPKTGPKNC